ILRGLWGRYDARRRNPYNHIECGDHYVRSMSGWTVLGAWTRRSWDAVTGSLTLRRPEPGERLPVLTAGGWGYAERDEDGGIALTTVHGDLGVRSLTVVEPPAPPSGQD